ncbi:hypothetical protein [Geminisphaera colitermitum]|uniref:hypothetical protein n=1 Tax=Geminisphaera colitermitum TaxID=1148786 RepID=UPI000158CEC7|nr:hypothetical protein [Geminisphaera colitermitum]
MTLKQLTEFCAEKIGINDITTRELAAKFAAVRWSMIWDSRAWTQSRIYDAVSVPTGQQEVTLPVDFTLVHTARWNKNPILPMDDITAFHQDPGAWDASGPIVAFSALPKDAEGRARIRLTRVPVESGTLYIIGKRRCPPLVNDNDEPTLTGISECLTAFVMADLEQWQRQFTKAREFLSEANALLKQAVEIDTQQATQVVQVIPNIQQLETSDF